MFQSSTVRTTALSSVVAAALLVLVPARANAAAAIPDPDAEEILITGTRAGEGVPIELFGSSVSIVSAQDVDVRQVRIVSDLLRDIPGIEVSRTGPAGGSTQARMRGGEGNHTLVLIDGMEAGDPFQGEFDFATLLADDMSRVEVVRGQQSALYGSDAVGGVIHYITATGAEAPGFRARLEGGSFGTGQASARAAGVSGALDYAVSGNYFRTEGVLGARGGKRKLGAETATGAVKTILTVTDAFKITGVARYNDSEGETNPQSFNCPGVTCGLAIDGDDSYDATARYGYVRVDLSLMGGAWSHALSFQANDARRKTFSGSNLSAHGYGSRMKTSYVTSYEFGSDMMMHRITFAGDYRTETYHNITTGVPGPANNLRHLDNTGLVGEYFLDLSGRTGIGAAIRQDWNDHFQDATTYRVQGSHLFDTGTRVRAAVGSGIKNPTNFELYGFDPATFVGNLHLKPERSTGWEAGIEQDLLGGQALAGVTYFNSTLSDEIFTSFSFPSFVATPLNRTTKSIQEGVEAFLQWRINDFWRVSGSYTYLHALENGVEEIRRAPHIANLNVDWRSTDDVFGVNVTIRYNGKQMDSNFGTGAKVVMPSFTLVNVGADWRLTDMFQLYGRVENLFDEKYEEVYSFPNSGIGWYLGLKIAT